MKLNDMKFLSIKIIKKNRKDIIQIIVSMLLLVFVLTSLTAHFSFLRFYKLITEESIYAHQLSISTDNVEMIDKIKELENVENVIEESKVIAHVNMNNKIIDFFAFTNYMSYVPYKFSKIKSGEAIVSKNLEMLIDGASIKGKNLVNRDIPITIEGIEIFKLKVVDVFNPQDYGIYSDSIITSSDNIQKIIESQNKDLDEYTSIGDGRIVSIKDSKKLNDTINKIKELGISVYNDSVEVDYDEAEKFNQVINLIMIISLVAYFIIKILYLRNYNIKEKKQNIILMAMGYNNNQMFSIYNFKNIMECLISYVLTLLIYEIGIIIYTVTQQDLVMYGFIAYIPAYVILLIFIVDFVITFIITKLYFCRISSMGISELMQND